MGSELQLSCCSHSVSVNAWTRGWGNTAKDKDLEGKLSCQLSQGSALLPLSFTVSPPGKEDLIERGAVEMRSQEA